MTEPFTLAVPEGFLDAVAGRAAEIVLERLALDQPAPVSPYLSVAEAADYLRAERHRVYDLLSSGRLTRVKDGSRVLIARAELEAHLATESRAVAQRLPSGARGCMNGGVQR